MPRVEYCDRCWDHNLEISQKAKKYHKVGHLCSNCYLAFEDTITNIKGGLK